MEGNNIAPGISIIVPVYKAEKYLQRCLKSILAQTFVNFELILIDDESPDSCPKICDEAEEREARIRVIHKKSQGPGFARNSGLKIARGEYIYFVDSDDYLAETAVETLYQAAKNGDMDLCFAGFFLVTNGVETAQIPKYAGKVFVQPQIVTMILTDMLGTAPEEATDCTVRMAVWQGIYRRSWLNEHKFQFASNKRFLSEDILFHMDCLPLAKRMCYLPDCLYYHTSDNILSWTHAYQSDHLERYGEQYLEELKKTKNLNNSAEMRRRIQRTYLGNVRICLQRLVSAANGMRWHDVKKTLRDLVQDPILQSVLKEYPYWRTPWQQRILSFFLRYKKGKIAFWLTWVYLKARRVLGRQHGKTGVIKYIRQ